MRRSIFCFSLLVLLKATSVFAYLHPSCGNFGFVGEYIFLLPSIDDTYFVIEAPTATPGPSGVRERNDFSFTSGFRVEGVYALCDRTQELHASYTRLRSHETRTLAGDFLWATLGSALLVDQFQRYSGTAFSKNDLLWHRFDGLFSQQVWGGCRAELYLYGGFEYAFIRVNGNVEYRRSSGEGAAFGLVHQKSRAWGLGPEFGGEFAVDICDFCFCSRWGTLSIVGSATGSLLVSQTKIKSNNQFAGTTALDASDKLTWRIIPAAHARFGLDYLMCFPWFWASFEIGYEFNTYIRAVNWQAFPHTLDGGLSSLCYTAYKNFDAHGLYLNLGLTY